jgi:hypothetical protein
VAQLYGPGPTEPPPLLATRDLAGLRATDVEDRPVGQLFGTLSEEPTGLIQYLDVSLDGVNKHVLVPVGHTRVDSSGVQPRIRLRAATYEDLLEIPYYVPGATELDGGYHERVLEAHGRLFYGSRYYAHPSFDHGGLFAGDDGPGEIQEGAAKVAEETPMVHPVSGLGGLSLGSSGRDLRGRRVQDGAGEAVGEVEDLLVDTASGSVRYAVIRLAEHSRLAALPIGYLDGGAEEDGVSGMAGPGRSAANRRVRVRALTTEDIRLLPPYQGSMTREDENRIRAAIEGRLSGRRTFQRVDFARHGIRRGGR